MQLEQILKTAKKHGISKNDFIQKYNSRCEELIGEGNLSIVKSLVKLTSLNPDVKLQRKVRFNFDDYDEPKQTKQEIPKQEKYNFDKPRELLIHELKQHLMNGNLRYLEELWNAKNENFYKADELLKTDFVQDLYQNWLQKEMINQLKIFVKTSGVKIKSNNINGIVMVYLKNFKEKKANTIMECAEDCPFTIDNYNEICEHFLEHSKFALFEGMQNKEIKYTNRNFVYKLLLKSIKDTPNKFMNFYLLTEGMNEFSKFELNTIYSTLNKNFDAQKALFLEKKQGELPKALYKAFVNYVVK